MAKSTAKHAEKPALDTAPVASPVVAPVIVVHPLPDLPFGWAAQFVKSGRIVLLVRDTHAKADEATLRERIARGAPLPVGMRVRGLDCDADTELLMEDALDTPFRIVAVAEPDTPG